MREPDLDNPNLGIFESLRGHSDRGSSHMVTVDTVEKVASRLHGGAGPSGTDAVDLCNWLLTIWSGVGNALREEMAQLTNWLTNNQPSWAAYRALMACRLVALDKTARH